MSLSRRCRCRGTLAALVDGISGYRNEEGGVVNLSKKSAQTYVKQNIILMLCNDIDDLCPEKFCPHSIAVNN
jgi:hypothetical protein